MFEITPFIRKNNNVYPYSYNPFKEIEEFEKSFWGNSVIRDLKTDITDNGDSYLLEADLPGFKKSDISIDIENDCLTITAERKSENKHEDKKGNLVRCERSYGSFSRSFDISTVNADEISASYEDGVLKLNLPKKKETAPTSRRLEIK